MENFSGDLADLRSLCTIIDCGGITRAAELLGETKGNVSRRITRLENQLGVKLLNRSSRAVSATEAGMAFYHRSLQALAVLDEGARELSHSRQAPSGLLRITMPMDLGLSIFPPLMAEFLDLYPEIRLDLVLSEQMLDLKTHQIDIALRVAKTLPDTDYLFCRLMPLSVKLFASSQYLARQGTPDHPDALSQHTILCHQRFPANKSLTFQQENRRISVKVQPLIMANDFTYLKTMAIAGAGIVLLPDYLGRTASVASTQEHRLIPVLSEWSTGESRHLYLLHEGWRLLPAKVTCFRDFIRDRLSGNED
jgi:DNA-binding transcriptional LysR family regulator